MNPGLFPPPLDEIIARSIPATWKIILGALGSLGSAGLAVAAVPFLAARILPPPLETRLAEYLPFFHLLPDRRTIACRRGALVRCWELADIDLAAASGERRDALHTVRKAWLDRMIDYHVTIHCYTIRDLIDPAPPLPPDHPLLAEITRAQASALGEIYRNRQILVLCASGAKAGENLDQASDVLGATLAEYKPRLLSDDPKELAAGPLALLARLVSPLSRPTPVASAHALPIPVNEALAADAIGFEGSDILFRSGNRTLHTAAIGIRRLADTTSEGFIDEISAIPSEAVIHTAIRPLARLAAMAALEHRRRLANIGKAGFTASRQYQEAIDLLEAQGEEHQTAHTVSQTIFLYNADPGRLEEAVRQIHRIAAQNGLSTVRESGAAQAVWFAQFPEFDSYARNYFLYSRNVASLVTFDRAAEGAASNPWGEGPLAVYKTAAGDAYRFHLHVRDDITDPVAHAVCIGPTGSGKSTFLEFLAACAHRYPRLRTLFFDRYNGLEIFTKSLGPDYARYIHFDGDARNAAMNPLQIADTAQNRDFLKLWLQTLTGCTDETSIAETNRAVDAAFNYMPRETRSLAAIHKTGFGPTSAMRRELRKWLPGGPFGSLFDAPRDSIDLGLRHIAFDFTQVLENDLLAPAVLQYLMHRIRATLVETGSAALIVIDETEPLLRNEIFKNKVAKPMLQEFRKLNSAIILCFQRPQAVDDLGMGDVVRGQCQTAFFFRNPHAEPRDYDPWHLSDREWDFIRGARASHLPHAVLLKRQGAGESVVLDIGLGALGPQLRLLSSSSRHVRLFRRIEEEGGDIVSAFLKQTE